MNKEDTAPPRQPVERVLRVCGRVQGVGFRPFVHSLATRLALRGWVLNDSEGVLVRVQGESEALKRFQLSLLGEAPPAARVEAVQILANPVALPALGEGFRILESEAGGPGLGTEVPADLALCEPCRRELLKPGDRRFAYPFINCTQCGPRYSIIEALPYDRERTSMRCFRLCPECHREYDETANRRFHAEPNACPRCGPRLTLLDAAGKPVFVEAEALEQAARALLEGRLVAVKGLGGYHLFADATRPETVAQLRRRKHRDEKPLAVMFPDLAGVKAELELGLEEERLLRSPAAPIVLLRRRSGSLLPGNLAPGNPRLGALLPYTPLHVLLTARVGHPLVATSANLSEEPLCISETEALERLRGIADAFLVHDRPILRPVDDSVVRVDAAGRCIVLRRARGHAPSQLVLPGTLRAPVLCLGAQLKASVAVAERDRLVPGPHVGDLENVATLEAYERCVAMLGQLCGSRPVLAVCDKHPGYSSTRYAERSGLPLLRVQHHLAHFLSCLLENRREPDGVLGVVWDGTGLGEDGAVWGGEFLLGRGRTVERFAHLSPFGLPGGDAAARDPRRTALSMYLKFGYDEREARAMWGADYGLGLSRQELSTLLKMIEKGVNTPACTSMGRLFDVAAYVLGAGMQNSFEGQLPLALEALAELGLRERAETRAGTAAGPRFEFPLRTSTAGAVWELDWREAVLGLRNEQLSAGSRALAFHEGLARAVLAVVKEAGVGCVALSGGCFQNVLLLDSVRGLLEKACVEVLAHRELPPGDGGIAAGQALAALWELADIRPGAPGRGWTVS